MQMPCNNSVPTNGHVNFIFAEMAERGACFMALVRSPLSKNEIHKVSQILPGQPFLQALPACAMFFGPEFFRSVAERARRKPI
jgi:hypothetical protein